MVTTVINVTRPTFARNVLHRPFLGFGVGVGEGGGVTVSASVRLLDENAFRWTYRESVFRRALDDLVARQVLRVATAAIRALKKVPAKTIQPQRSSPSRRDTKKSTHFLQDAFCGISSVELVVSRSLSRRKKKVDQTCGAERRACLCRIYGIIFWVGR